MKIVALPSVFFYFGISHLKAQSNYSKLQAAYIYNFAKYITWSYPSDTFYIAIYGNIQIARELSVATLNKRVNGIPIRIKIINDQEPAKNCQLVFLAKQKSRELSELLKVLMDRQVLLVTEDDLISKGAGISFIVRNNMLRFKLNETYLKKANLKASEGLLNLAILSSE